MITDDQELLEKLYDMRKHGETYGNNMTVMTHLFGIVFTNDIGACGMNPTNLAETFADQYGTTAPRALTEGVKLEKYVSVHPAFRHRWRAAP